MSVHEGLVPAHAARSVRALELILDAQKACGCDSRTAAFCVRDFGTCLCACHRRCTHCGGIIGPDVTGRPACYGCAPIDMLPREVHERRQSGHVFSPKEGSNALGR